jgi:hypothetical protein
MERWVGRLRIVDLDENPIVLVYNDRCADSTGRWRQEGDPVGASKFPTLDSREHSARRCGVGAGDDPYKLPSGPKAIPSVVPGDEYTVTVGLALSGFWMRWMVGVPFGCDTNRSPLSGSVAMPVGAEIPLATVRRTTPLT